LVSGDHSDAILRTHVNAKAAAVAGIAIYLQLFVVELSGSEVTDLGAFSATGAPVVLGLLYKISLVAAVLTRLQKMHAAVVTAKAYAVGLSHILFVSKRSGYQMLILCLPKNLLYVVPRDLLSTGTAAARDVAPEHQTDICARAAAASAILAAPAVRYPESVVLPHYLLTFFPRANIVKGQIFFVHDSLLLDRTLS
jgi:hypothetical protein